ncbi:MAG: substrate-binding domain-containing protein, partial [Thermodesulfobacteriota bacterium]
MKKIFSVAVILACVLSFVQAEAADKLNGAGASFPYPVYSAWAFDYNKATGVQLNYQSIGSGGGIRQITERTVDFGASDAPLTPEQLAK